MAVHKPIALCIGKSSMFGQRVMEMTGCTCFDSDDTDGLLCYIDAIKNGLLDFNTDIFFTKYMSITKNSMKYADIIEDAQ